MHRLQWLVFTLLFVFTPLIFHAQAEDAMEFNVIHMRDTGYTPINIRMYQGETLRFENDGTVDHWPASNIHPTHSIYSEFDPQKPVLPGQAWEFVFTKPGVWRYHDHLNPQIVGTITVVEDKDYQADMSPSPSPTPSNQQLFSSFSIQGLIDTIKKLIGREEKPKPPSIEKDSSAIFTNTQALYQYVKEYGPRQTTLRLNELSATYGDCHQVAHTAGRLSYEVYGDKSFGECSSECHSGCYHGATEAYFKEHGTANLTENLQLLCGDISNTFMKHQCVHGIGHGLMAWTNYDLPEALTSCDILDKNQDSCYSGVFMENVVGGLATESGHMSRYLTNDTHYPCTAVDKKYEGACYYYQTSRVAQLFPRDFAKMASFCLEVPSEYRRGCFESMGRDVDGIFRPEPEKTIAECQHAPKGDYRIGCITGAVQDTFWDPTGQDLALRFCSLLVDPDEKSACYRTIGDRANAVFSTPREVRAFCHQMPNAYLQKCLQFTRS